VDSMTEPATSFGRVADVYDRARPAYPAEAVAWMLPAGVRDVLDVGAGTGKLTAVLAAAGRAVTAIDPDPLMLQKLQEKLPGIPTLVGSGETIPLPDASADAAVFGQSWHWVDPPAASREVGRVLRPGGTLGLIWNIRDVGVPWVAGLGEVMHGSAAENLLAAGDPVVEAPFGPLEAEQFRWVNPTTVDGLADMVSSRSYVIGLPAAERDALLARVRELALDVADEHGAIDMPYVTHVYRAVRSA